MSVILYEKRDRIAYLTINRPEAMNALGLNHNAELIQRWLEFRDDPEVWVAILTGAGDKAFCAGADLKTYTPSLGRVLEDALRFENILFSTLTQTEDYQEGPKAFAEKRDPVWKGR